MTALRLDAIPGYVVHELLETSLVTSTYLASRARDGYPVMLEILNDPPASLEAIEHFRASVEAVAAIRHPVIPTIREIGEADDRLYIVSNAVEGRALATALRDGRPLPMPEALAVCTELADALDMLNSAGVVHGAVTPLTVWLNDRSRAPAAPFVALRGHGTVLPGADELAAIGELPPPDDLRYLAPEQLRGEPPSERSDQYALACLTLHCLTGVPPFAPRTLDDLVHAHLLTAPDDGILHAGALDPQIVAGLRRALAKDPAERFPTSLALADAIGGGAGRSWSWMDQADGTPQVHHQIDITDDTGPAEPTGGRVAHGDDHVAWSDGRQATGSGLTGRSLKDVDWLPDSATSTGPQRPVRPDPRVTGATTGTRVRRAGLLPSGPLRWALLAGLLVLVVVAAVVTGRRLIAPAAEAAGGAVDAAATTEVQASWREQVNRDAPLSHLAAFEDELVAVVGDELLDLDQATAQERWRTPLDGEITGLSTLGDMAIAHVGGGYVGVDRTTGDVRWRSSATGLPELAAVVTGRGRMFGVALTEGAASVHAVDPGTGEVGWSIDGDPEGATDDGPVAVAFDGSEEGQRTLYVMQGEMVTAFDTVARRPRWRVAVDGARPATLTALAGALLVLTEDGRLCRYGADAGRPVWSACASLDRRDADARIVSVRDSRVIVAGTHEVMSVDFTSGQRQWRITSDRALQPEVTTSPTATYIAAPDGTIEAIGQRTGASLWETSPYGPVTAMTATDDAVFVATEDGRLTRIEAAAADG